jgi:hypothetical protein
MYRSNRPLLSVAAALAVLGAMLLVQYYVDRAPETALSPLSAADAHSAREVPPAIGEAKPTDLEASLAVDAMSVVGRR